MTVGKNTRLEEASNDTELPNTAISKHTHGTLTPSILAEIVNTALVNIKRSIVFAKGLRNEFDSYVYEQLVDGTVEFSLLQSLFDGYLERQ